MSKNGKWLINFWCIHTYGPTLFTDNQKEGWGLPQGKNVEKVAKLEEH